MKYLRKVKFSDKIYSPDFSTTFLHGFLKKDKFNLLKFSEEYQNKVIEREKLNFKKWSKYIEPTAKEWMHKTMEIINKNGKQTNNDLNSQEIENFIYYEKSNGRIKSMYRKNKISNKEEELFSIDKLNIDKKFVEGSTFKLLRVKNDILTFIIDIDNNEMTIGGVFDMKHKIMLNDSFTNLSSIEFSKNSDSMFILKNDENFRPCEVVEYDYNLNKETQIYKSINNNEYVEISTSCNKDFLFINSVTKDDSEIHFIDLNNSNSSIDSNNSNKQRTNSNFNLNTNVKKLFSRKSKTKYFVDFWEGNFFIMSNLNIKADSPINESYEIDSNIEKSIIKPEKYFSKYKLYKLPLSEVSKLDFSNVDSTKRIIEKLNLIIEPQEYEYFEEMHVVKNHVILFAKLNLIPSVLVYDIKSEKLNVFSVEGLLGSINSGTVDVSNLD